MGAGKAAVAASAVTAVVSLAAIGRGLLTFRMNTEAMQKQALDQSVAEHGHWLRCRRAETCLHFLQQLDEVETRADAVQPDRDASTRTRLDLHDSTRDVLYGGMTEDMATPDNTISHIRLIVPALVSAANDFHDPGPQWRARPFNCRGSRHSGNRTPSRGPQYRRVLDIGPGACRTCLTPPATCPWPSNSGPCLPWNGTRH
ncbi:hypothetical protein RKD44_005109 [Streptomyces collinus]